MNGDYKNHMFLLAIVAIVAIVAIILLVISAKTPQDQAAPVQTNYFSPSDVDLTGQNWRATAELYDATMRGQHDNSDP